MPTSDPPAPAAGRAPVAVDLLVVGAGPAGVAAATTAVDAGLSVLACDRARFPRDKTCGDGLTAAALRLLEGLGLDAPALPGYRRIDGVRILGPAGDTIDLPLPTGPGDHAAVVRRTELDAALVDLARARGVRLLEEAPLTALTAGPGEARVTAHLGDGSTVTARWVVAADGQWSPTRRLVAPGATGRDPGEWHAARQYVTGVTTDRLWVLFEPDLLPGYAWVFPLPGDTANVGFGVLRGAGRKGRELAALWPDVLARPGMRRALGPDASPAGPMRAWPIPSRYDPARLAAGRVLFAGDAAGVVDPMTGEGIAQALETGVLAARAVAASGAAGPAAVAARYRHAVARHLGADLRFAGALQRLVARPRVMRAALGVVDANDWTRRNFARWMWEDYPRALLGTPRRWQRSMLARPGAYAARAG